MDEVKKNEEGKGEKKVESALNDLQKCRKERDEYLEGWKRARADLANYKKDEAKRIDAVLKFGQEEFIKELITVLDSFELAILALENQARNGADPTRRDEEKLATDRNLRGMYLIRSQLEDILRRNGLERISVKRGEIFNPELVEVVAAVESSEASGTIIEEMEKGYKLNGKVIRPARVKVSK